MIRLTTVIVVLAGANRAAGADFPQTTPGPACCILRDSGNHAMLIPLATETKVSVPLLYGPGPGATFATLRADAVPAPGPPLLPGIAAWKRPDKKASIR